jgi:hypothetical protein
MPRITFEEVRLNDVAAADDRALFKRFQQSGIVVLVVELGRSDLVTLVGIAPKHHYLGRDWWLGGSYTEWSNVASCDRPLAKRTVRAVSDLGVDYRAMPMQLVSLGGWFFHEKGNSIPTWNTDLVISATLPVTALRTALEAIKSGQALLDDYTFASRKTSHVNIQDQHGVAELERAFAIKSSEGAYYRTMYRYLGEAEMTQQRFSKPHRDEQAKHLDSTLQVARTILKKARDSQELAKGAQRIQHLYLLNAFEFDESLVNKVCEINGLRCEILESAKLPHFYESLEIRTPDVAGELKKRYEYLPNDADWARELRASSPQSFSAREMKLVEAYLKSVRHLYPILESDPLKQDLPRLAAFTPPRNRRERKRIAARRRITTP